MLDPIIARHFSSQASDASNDSDLGPRIASRLHSQSGQMAVEAVMIITLLLGLATVSARYFR